MEQLRKIGLWLLLTKERIILCGVVLFFLVRLYQVFSPTPPPDMAVLPAPSPEIPADSAVAPPSLPPSPAPIRSTPAEALASSNPFTVQSSPPTDQRKTETEKAPNLVLRRVREGRGGAEPEAEIQVQGGERGRYKVNDTFGNGQFRVQRVDPAGQSVEVWSEAERKVITLRAGG